MAISMTKWVDIVSTSMPAGAADRELILRLITKSNKIDENTVYEMTSAADVLDTFGVNSEEYGIAKKYFSFVSLSATKAQKISFWRPGTYTVPEGGATASGGEVDTTGKTYTKGETIPASTILVDDIDTTLTKCADASDNFATFFFVGREDFGAEDYKKAASWAALQNYKFRFVVPVFLDALAKRTGSISWVKANTADAVLGNYKYPCVTAVLDDAFARDGGTTSYPEWLTCALLASTKYSRTNSTIIQEFKALDSADMTVTCDCDSLYNILTKLNVNFYGQTQKAGKKIAFYMEGFNLNGDDTSVCDNEIWLKDRIVTEVFNRFVKCNKVPAGNLGVAMIKTAVQGVISQALNNLAITPEKTISDSDKAAIIQNTGATEAPAAIYSDGYFLQISEADPESVGAAKRRVVDYILYYSTGEGIRKVTGSHVLV